MKVVRRSSLKEYTIHFLENERRKVCEMPDHEEKIKEIEEVQRSSDPVSWLKENTFSWLKHGKNDNLGYKLPLEHYSEVFLVAIESLAELEHIRIYDRLLSDQWMQERQLSPDPSKPSIGALADYFLSVGYFSRPPDNAGQYKRYHEWKPQGHLTGAISSSALPLIQPHNNGPNFEIVRDGAGSWRMLLCVKRVSSSWSSSAFLQLI
jgi:hypothetical protein